MKRNLDGQRKEFDQGTQKTDFEDCFNEPILCLPRFSLLANLNQEVDA